MGFIEQLQELSPPCIPESYGSIESKWRTLAKARARRVCVCLHTWKILQPLKHHVIVAFVYHVSPINLLQGTNNYVLKHDLSKPFLVLFMY